MLKGWLGFGGGEVPAQVTHNKSTQSLSALDEPQALDQAMKAMDLLLNDDVLGAEKAVEGGNSSYHKLAGGVVAFLRASLGFETEIMKEASERLADAEASAERDRKKSIKENHHRSSCPVGAEFALAHAEAQLMSAVVAVLSESVIESMKAVYKLRTAYKTLEGIQNEMAKGLMQLDGAGKSRQSLGNGSNSGGEPSVLLTPGLEMKGSGASIRSTGSRPNTARIRSENLVDEFVISGVNLCFGVLLLILSMIPPSMRVVMSAVGFRGDREKGIEMLWKASTYSNLHGAIAVLAILQYYGNSVQFCDILPPQDHPSGAGYPKQKCQEALERLRAKYSKSALWRLEEARMFAVDRQMDEAIAILAQPTQTQMRQVEALTLFEKSLNLMFMHRYEETIDGFLKLTELNTWSPALYHYFAAVCQVELYRKYLETDKEKSNKHGELAEELFEKIPTFMGKKRFMAQGLPLEMFADRKLKKWKARALAKGVRAVEGVGVSPVEEMIYFWNGYKRMDQSNFEVSKKALLWQDEEMTNDAVDEQAIQWILLSVVSRNLDKMEETKTYIQNVLTIDRNAFKGLLNDNWMAPTAHYEWAVALWKEHGQKEYSEIKSWLDKAANWGAFELDARVGLRVTTALDTINRLRKWEQLGSGGEV